MSREVYWKMTKEEMDNMVDMVATMEESGNHYDSFHVKEPCKYKIRNVSYPFLDELFDAFQKDYPTLEHY